jgi:PAS domain S-box-containing protein
MGIQMDADMRFPRRRTRVLTVIALLLVLLDVVRLFVLPQAYQEAFMDGFESVVGVLCVAACWFAAKRSSRVTRGLWIMSAIFFALLASADCHDFFHDLAVNEGILSSVAEFLGWSQYLPLALLVFFPVEKGDRRDWTWLPFLDFLLVTVAAALAYFRLIYLPHSLAGERWFAPGHAELVRNILLSGGLLLRSGFDPSSQSRYFYRRIGGVFGAVTILHAAFPGYLDPVSAVGRPVLWLVLGILAVSSESIPPEETARDMRRDALRLALSLFSAATLLLVAVLAMGTPAPYRSLMNIGLGISVVLFFSRSYVAEHRRYAGESKLRASEQDYRVLFERAAVPIVIFEPETERILQANAEACELYGVAREEFVGASFKDFTKDAARGEGLIAEALKAGVCRRVESVHRRRDGREIHVLISASVIQYRGQKAILSFNRDITGLRGAENELRRLNRALQTISLCNELLVQAQDEQQFLDSVCKILVGEGGYRMAWVGYAEKEGAKKVRPVAYAGYEDGYLSWLDISWADGALGHGPTRACIRTGLASVNRNTGTSPGLSPWREEMLKRGYFSSIALPLGVGSEIIGALSIYAAEPEVFDSEEVKLLSRLADDVGLGVETIRLRAEHRQAEELLKEQAREITELYEQAPWGYHSLSGDGTYLRINATELKWLGYKREEIVGKIKFADLVTPKSRAAFCKNFADFMERGEAQDLEYEMVRKDGSILPVLLSATAVKDDEGEFRISRGTLFDISERKRVEEELRLTQFSLEHASDAVFWVDAQGRIRYVNEAACRSVERSRNELLSLSVPDINPDISLEVWKTAWERVKAQGSRTFETSLQTKTGRVFPVEITTNYLDFGGKEYAFAFARDITARKRSEAALQQSEARLRSVFRAAPVGICIMKDRVFQAANDSWYKIIGYTEAELIGQTPRHLYESEEEYQRVGRELHTDLPKRGTVSVGTRLRRGDGAFRDVILTAAALNAHDSSASDVVTIRDVTDDKRAEEARRESERKYRELVEHANSIILRWSHDGRVLFLNEFGQRFFGYTEAEICGRHVVGTIVPETESGSRKLLPLMDQICANPTAFEQNVNENMRRNGERVWVAWTNKVVLNQDGQVDGVLSIGTDITARKEAEEALRRSEEKFRLITENVADMVAVFDLKGRRLYNSPSYASILSEPDELRGSLSFEQIRPEDQARVREAFQSTVRTGTGHRLEYRLMDRDGRPRYIESQGSVIRDAQGRVAQVVVVSRDVTARHQAEQAIRELNTSLERRVAERTAELASARDRAESADRVKSAFLATMSHELRTPLNSIIGFTGLLLQGLAGPLNAEQCKQLGMVKDSGQHLLALINDVLDISKIEAGQIEILNEPFDLSESIQKVVRTVTPLAEKKRLPLNTRLGQGVGRITSDRRRVEQILLNLLSNAIKFTERGEVTVAAELTPGAYAIAHPTLCISVADTGIGIQREDLDKLFQPFRQLDTGLTRQHDGTGLGLVICKRLVERLGGTITVESEWSKGSTFHCLLPIHPERKS